MVSVPESRDDPRGADDPHGAGADAGPGEAEPAELGPPGFRGPVATDARLLAELVGEREKALDGLPAPPERDAGQRIEAGRVHDLCRRARDHFLARHADAVYAALTVAGTRRVRAGDLVLAAAERYPGLVPTREQMARESSYAQADKEGREIDQGLFFRAVLRSPAAGRHLVDTMLTAGPRALELVSGFLRAGRVELGGVTIERRGAAAHLTMRYAHNLNAEDNALIDDMDTAVDLALLDPGVRVGVLRGAPMAHRKYAGRRVFSAGLNLTDLHEGRISYADFLMRRELGFVHKLYRGLLPASRDQREAAWPHRTVHKPWVAAVDTFAIGGGAQLLLAFDHVVADADAYFSLPAAQEGIVPGVANFRLGRLAGSRLTRQIILGGRRVRAGEPAGALLFDEVVDAGEMDRAVDAAVAGLAAPAVVANRRMLHAAEEPIDAFREYMAEFALEQAVRLYSPDVLGKVGRRARRGSPAAEDRPQT